MGVSERKLVYPYENFNSFDDHQKPVNNLKKEDFFNKLKRDCPSKNRKNKRKYKNNEY